MLDFLLTDLGRKFLLTLLLIFMAFVFVLTGKMTIEVFMAFSASVAGGYGVLNVFEAYSPTSKVRAENFAVLDQADIVAPVSTVSTWTSPVTSPQVTFTTTETPLSIDSTVKNG